MELEDFYTDTQNRKYVTKLVGQNLVYLRGDNWGHITNLVVPTVDGVPDFSRARKFAERTQAIAYIYKEEQRYPEQYISSQAREILKKYGK